MFYSQRFRLVHAVLLALLLTVCPGPRRRRGDAPANARRPMTVGVVAHTEVDQPPARQVAMATGTTATAATAAVPRQPMVMAMGTMAATAVPRQPTPPTATWATAT